MNSSSCSKEPEQEIEAQSNSSYSKEEEKTHIEIGGKSSKNIHKADYKTLANRKQKVCLMGDSLVG